MNVLNELIFSDDFKGTDYDRAKVEEIFKNLPCEVVEGIIINLKKDPDDKCFNRYFGLKEIIYYTQYTAKEFAKNQARNARIKGFVGSALEQEELLERFFLKQFSKQIPQWVF